MQASIKCFLTLSQDLMLFNKCGKETEKPWGDININWNLKIDHLLEKTILKVTTSL
jgi:hypothetical protein